MLAGEWDRPYPRTTAVYPVPRPRSAGATRPGAADRPGLRRPQPGLLVPAAGVVRLALWQALDDVHEHDVRERRFRDALGRGGADVPCADDGDEWVGHGRATPRLRRAG